MGDNVNVLFFIYTSHLMSSVFAILGQRSGVRLQLVRCVHVCRYVRRYVCQNIKTW